MVKTSLADIGENLAKLYLINNKYKFIANNYHCIYGEIDLIFLINDELVFVEVKTRNSKSAKWVENCISKQKQKRICLTALTYIAENLQYSDCSARFDAVIVIYNPTDDTYSIKHIVNAFLPTEWP